MHRNLLPRHHGSRYNLHSPAAPLHATTALAHRQPRCKGAATPAADVAVPVGDRAGRGQQPLAGALQSAPFTDATLQAGVPTSGCRPCGLVIADRAYRRPTTGCCPREWRRPPLWVVAPASGAGLPCGLLPLRATSASLAG
ncbi:hypothetical protein GW17_00046429 [Ensete ventricosum]|nr:hypothetical protein GW17_00046429 [Ensete ventricosum]